MRPALFALALLAAPAFAAPADDYRELRQEIWEWTLDENPLLATEVGDRRGDGKLADYSIEAYDRAVAAQREFLERLDAIDAEALPEDLAVDRAVVRRGLADNIALSAFDQDRYILFTNRGGWHMWFASLPEQSPFYTREDYASYIGRLEAFAKQNEQAIGRSREAVARGLAQPCEAMRDFARTIEGRIAESAESSAFWAPFAERPSTIRPEVWEDLKRRARTAIETGVIPAYQAFADFYAEEYAPNCRRTLGISETPDGRAYYDARTRSYTTTALNADEIHQIGLEEVARIRAEMREVAAKAGYASLGAYIEHLRTDPVYYPKSAEQLLMTTAALAKHIDGWLPQLFGKLPRLPYTVAAIPEAEAVGNTTAYYESGSPEIGRAGVYRVNTTELDQRPFWEIPALTVHEAVPGHHLQIALQQELDMHPLRRHGTFFTVFVEGWGLYSERLGNEMGLYDTPAKQMGRLSYEMWRAARLVVDTGIHAKGWTKQQAVDFMTENTALSAANIDAEVNRYITWPGQALAYKIGELKISGLRDRAEAALGRAFDLRAFHDAVLENGAVPLDVLEAHIGRWIAAQQAAS